MMRKFTFAAAIAIATSFGVTTVVANPELKPSAAADTDKEGGGSRSTTPTTVDPTSEARISGSHIVLEVLDDEVYLTGSGEAATLNGLAIGLANRCGPTVGSGVLWDAPLDEVAAELISALGCSVSTMSVTLRADGGVSGVIGVTEKASLDRLRELMVPGIDVVEDFPD